MPRPDHGDEFEAEGEGSREGEASGENTGRKKRIDLSMAQVAGAGVATLTAATAASYLNVYGTVIGTGIMAVLSTSAAPVIQHWITRSSEQAKELAEKKSAKQAGAQALVEAEANADQVGLDTDATRVVSPEAPDPFGFPESTEDADATRTMAIPMVGRELPGQTVAHGFGNPEDPTVVGGTAAADATELMPSVGDGPGGPSDADGSDEGADAERPNRSWRTAVISAAAVFTLVMLVILAFELLTGRSLTSWTQGQDEPTSPSLFGGNSAPAQVEEETPETTGDDDQPQVEGDPGTQDQWTDAPVDPEPTTPPAEPQPEVPGGGGQTDPTGPPVDGGEPVEPGDGEVPDPGSENQPEGNDQPEPAPAPGG